MKIVIIGATGTIGKAVAAALRGKHEVIAVSRSAADYHADITDKSSLEKAFRRLQGGRHRQRGGGAVFKPLAALADADFEKCLHDKLMGQVNVVGSVRNTFVLAARLRSLAACWRESRCPAPQRSAWSTPGSRALAALPRWSWETRRFE